MYTQLHRNRTTIDTRTHNYIETGRQLTPLHKIIWKQDNNWHPYTQLHRNRTTIDNLTHNYMETGQQLTPLHTITWKQDNNWHPYTKLHGNRTTIDTLYTITWVLNFLSWNVYFNKEWRIKLVLRPQNFPLCVMMLVMRTSLFV